MGGLTGKVSERQNAKRQLHAVLRQSTTENIVEDGYLPNIIVRHSSLNMNPSRQTSSSSLVPNMASELRSETKEFLQTLHSYLDCREQMDAKYLEVDEFQRIRARSVKDDSLGGIKENNNNNKNNSSDHQFKAEYRQQSPNGNPVEGMDELYRAAEMARPTLQEKVEQLVKDVCQDCNDGNESNVQIKFPELKGRERASRKAQDDYSSRLPGPGIAWLYDILRCSILFESADQVLQCIDILERDDTFHIVKVTNRFQTPALTGYRDLNFHIRLLVMNGDGEFFQHICEIQVHHKAIQCLDHILTTHKYYEYFRSYFAGATGTLTERLNDLKLIGEGAAVDESFLDELLEQKSEKGDIPRLRRLAKLFEDQLCEHGWALKVWERVLFLETELMGEDSVVLSDNYYHMAGSLRKLGEVERSLELYQKALDMRKEHAGEDPINGLESYRYSLDRALMQKGLVSLADIYNDMGLLLFEQQVNLRESVLHFQRSLKIKQEHYQASQHPSIAKTYANLGMVQRFNDQLDEAMETYENVLLIYKTCYGEDHLAVAETYRSIALVSHDQRDFAKAMEMNELALELIKKQLGEEHIKVAEIYHDMGNVLRSRNYEKAMELFEKALGLKSKMLPPAHPSIGDTHCRMGDTFLVNGRLEKAMESYQVALGVYQSVYGDDCHSDIADTYKGMSLVLRGQGDLEGSREYQSKSVAIIRTVYKDSMHLR